MIFREFYCDNWSLKLEEEDAIRQLESIGGGKISAKLSGEIKRDEVGFIILKGFWMTVYKKKRERKRVGGGGRRKRERWLNVINDLRFAPMGFASLRERTGFRETTLLKSCTPGGYCYLKPATAPRDAIFTAALFRRRRWFIARPLIVIKRYYLIKLLSFRFIIFIY